jgi:ketosteroid isomerase-like protein
MGRAFLTSRLPVLALAAIVFALPQRSLAFGPPHKHEAREEVLSLERQWRTAQLSGDVALMSRLLSDDYLGITPNGAVLTKTQLLNRMRDHALNITSLQASDIKIKLVGQIAIVTSLARVQGVNENHTLNGDYRYTRIYQHLPSGIWKITNFEATRVHVPHHRNAEDASATPAPSD